MPIEYGYVGEKPLVKEEDRNYNHIHKCPRPGCGEWVCDDKLCMKYSGMRIWCHKHSHMPRKERENPMRYW